VANLTFATNDALQLLIGYVYLDPSTQASYILNVPRAGVTWRPLRGRLTLENRTLIEHRSGRSTTPRRRNWRNRVWRVSGPPECPAQATLVRKRGGRGCEGCNRRLNIGLGGAGDRSGRRRTGRSVSRNCCRNAFIGRRSTI
jgi:hypothetical protein